MGSLDLRGVTGTFDYKVTYTLDDAAMIRIRDAARVYYGENLTNKEVFRKMFDEFVSGWLNRSHHNERKAAATEATAGINPDAPTDITEIGGT
jgi:hypothetical protein